jgi:serine/threonine-protein kinase RsbW
VTVDAPDDCTVCAQMERLGGAIEFVEEFCAAHGIAQSDALRLSIVVEELFTNTVLHGHAGGSDAPVRLSLRADASHLELSYEDSAPPFDPLDHVARAPIDPAASLTDRPIGHVGITLIVNMAERISYARADGCNRVRLALRRHGPVSTPGGPA